MNKLAKIYVAGHKGMIGSAIVKKLQEHGYRDIIVKTHDECDLTDPGIINRVFEWERPDYVFLAAKVGNDNNTYPAESIYQNLIIQTNVIHVCYKYSIKKLLFLGSSCIYPENCKQPIVEESLLTGGLEPNNQWHAVAKIAGVKMCQAYGRQYGSSFISVIPTNLYGGPGAFYGLEANVLSLTIRKFHEAKIQKKSNVMMYGTGKVRRAFLHVDDFADACIFVMNNYTDSEILNIGTGKDINIYELSQTIKKIVEYKGVLAWDVLHPEDPIKFLDCSKLTRLGWSHKIELEQGIKKTYKIFLKELKKGTARLC